MTRRLVVVSAGLSTPSSTRLLADQLTEATTAAVSARGEALQVDVVELRELAVDLAQMLVTGGLPSKSVVHARDLAAQADGMIAVTPVFNASYSGLFKMFFDVLDTSALEGLPVLVAATAGTARHSLVLDHAIRPLFGYLRAVVAPTGVFAATDDFATAELGQRIGRAAAELASLMVATATGVDGFVPEPHHRRSGNDIDTEVTPFAQLLSGHRG